MLLLEAGGPDHHPWIHIPLGLGRMHARQMFDWGYHGEPEANLNGRRIEAMRGKVLGGSSSINVMAFTRGHPGDYDRWAQKGAHGWSYADVLPYFKRVETWQGGENFWRGGSGPVGVEWARTRDPLYEAWLAAAKTAGLPVTDDYNGGQAEGFGRSQYSIRHGRRSSAATAYLVPARERANLTVATGAHATRILLQGTRAIGVEFFLDGQRVSAEASREVILCGGAFNTPQLLMLSGIGPAEHLRATGLTPVVNLPVGRNLQDHLAVFINFARRDAGPFHAAMRVDRMALAMIQAHWLGTGPGTVVPGGLHAFIKTRQELAVPDIEFMFRGAPPDAHLWFPLLRPAYADGFSIRPALLHPTAAARCCCAPPIRAVRPLLSETFCPHPTICRACAKGFGAPATSPARGRSIRSAAPRPGRVREPPAMPISMRGSGARPSRHIIRPAHARWGLGPTA